MHICTYICICLYISIPLSQWVPKLGRNSLPVDSRSAGIMQADKVGRCRDGSNTGRVKKTWAIEDLHDFTILWGM